MRGEKISPLSLASKGKTIELINRRLSDPELSFTNETIAAVVGMTTFEVRIYHSVNHKVPLLMEHIQCGCGNLEALKYHMKGLHQMIRQRGGAYDLGYNGVLAGCHSV